MPYGQLQFRIDRRLGQIGQNIGQPFNVYRVGSTNSGDFPNNWTLVGSVNAYRYRVPSSKLEVGVEKADLLYNIFLNAGNYYLGDTFICTDPALVPGQSYGPEATILPSTLQINAFTLAWHMPVRIPVAARIDRRCRVYRPALTPSVLSDGSFYFKETNDNDQPLVLNSGVFSFGAAGSGVGSWVPLGMQSVTRRSDYAFEKEPGIVRSIAWHAYLPPLPGYEPSEGDALITEDGARYVILGSFNQEAGLVGNQMVVDRKISQTA
jgi:hypothetical protein